MALPPVALRSAWPFSADELVVALRSLGWGSVEAMDAPSDFEGRTVVASAEVLDRPLGVVAQTTPDDQVVAIIVTDDQSRCFVVGLHEGVPGTAWAHVQFDRRAQLDLDATPWWYDLDAS